MPKLLCKHNVAFSVFLATILSFATSPAVAKVIKEERSLYRNILVDEHGERRCLKFSVKRRTSSQSCINLKQPNKLVFDYTKFMMASLVFHAKPERVLIIGLGGGTLSNVLLDMYPNIEIDNVEIDPAVVRVARQYFNFIETGNVKSHTQDGRIFIKRALLKSQKYDAIFLDAFNGEYIPEHLLTKEFLQEAQALLSADGMLVANTFSSSTLYDHESATYHAVFGGFYAIEKSFKRGNRVIIVNMDKTVNTDENVELLAPALGKFDVDVADILSLLDYHQPTDSEARVLTDQYSPANLL
ncbi:spermidine synthase [Thalassotalea maritima]|uniref:spermidine synthase n=1 Tax=Thalassotalea maritima TaxID=3242416 RepID=UPI0035289402